MRLSDLFGSDAPPAGLTATQLATDITGLSADSRAIEAGNLFAALPGTRADGRHFIADAVGRGAAAVLANDDVPDLQAPDADTVALIRDPNPRRRLALMAARYYGAQPATAVAVTGTNGKTSVALFTQQLWAMLGRKAASLGTLGIMAPGRDGGGSLTTPDPVTLHSDLAALAQDGIDHLAMEASSHGLDQYRLDGVRFAAAGFTNLSRDHLDYHGSMDAYRAAKMRLFTDLLADDGTAVLNADSDAFSHFEAAALARGCQIVTYGRNGVDFRIEGLEPLGDGQIVTLTTPAGTSTVKLSLPGEFQILNALCAAGLVVATGADIADVLPLLAELKGVPGRLELSARHPNGAPVYVDYAHTPDALAHVLRALRPHTRGRLSVVFGCGGDRDRGKRAMMGDVASALADDVIVTDDNPRTEAADAIRAEIMTAAPDAQEIGDRAEAIRAAIAQLNPDDVLVVAGKGHEAGQIVGDTVRPFDDREVAAEAAASLSEGVS